MNRRLLTGMRHFGLSATLLLFLANCQQVNPAGVAGPPAPDPEKRSEELSEALRSMCLAWFNSLATWEDGDREVTKNQIDYSYRAQEASCAPYQQETPK